MKVSREAAAETRRRIVDTAGRLFRERGYDRVGVADVMKQAGLTHGGFYGHFASKDALVAEGTAAALAAKAGVWDALSAGPDGPDLRAFVASYLTPAHRDAPGNGCAFASLAAGAAHEQQPVRAVFGAAIRSRLDKLAAIVPGRSAVAKRQAAIATLSGLVGALMLSRAVDDPALSDEILRSAKEAFQT